MKGTITYEEATTYGTNAVSREKPRVTGIAIWCATFVSFSGLWQYGYSTGSVNAAYTPVTKFIKEQYESRYKMNVTLDEVNAIWVTSSSIYPIGGMLGTFLVAPLVRRLGRRTTILFGHITTVFLSVLMGLSAPFRLPELIIIARFGLGAAGGAIGTGVCPMYVAEISPIHVRGIFGSMIGTSMSFGNFASNILGLPEVLGNDEMWPVFLALTGLPSLCFIILYKTFPESPRQLFLEEDDKQKAVKVLQKLNGTKNVNAIIAEMMEERKATTSIRQMSIIEVLQSSNLRQPIIAAIFLACAQQLTGVNGVVSNMNFALLEAGLAPAYTPYASVGVTGFIVVGNLISMLVTEKYGRKNLLIIGFSIEAVNLMLLALSTQLHPISSVFSYLAVVFSLGFLWGFAFGPATMTHIMIAEFFDQASRPAGMVLSSAVLWLSFAVCVFITPYMLGAIHGYTFLPYCALSVISVVFIVWKVPETKNRIFSEVFNSPSDD